MGGGCLAREKHKETVFFDLCLVTGQTLRAGERGGRGMDEGYLRSRHSFCRGTEPPYLASAICERLSPGCHAQQLEGRGQEL